MASQNTTEYLVHLPLGTIRGVQREGIYGDYYYSFEGIPYAKPPLGDRRFKAPEPPDPWNGIKNCTHFSNKPMQNNIVTGQVEGSEDCLYLNVYSKKLSSAKPLPVMVWIYGGGFYMGEASRDLNSPDYFMSEDVILVTFNYRLCSLGFLSLKDPELDIPGNAGLKDQVMALKWVKENIGLFNGDMENITLFGVSAGAASTHYMATTERTKDLFHKAILMSGCNLNNWAVMPENDLPYRLAKYWGYQGDTSDKEVLKFLRSLEPSKLVNHNLITIEDRRKGFLFSFGPSIEPYYSPDCVIGEHPLELCKKAWSNKIPIMIGGTSFEGLLMYSKIKMYPQSVTLLNEKKDKILPPNVVEKMTEEEKKLFGEKLFKMHFGNEVPTDNDILKLLDILSIKMFWHGFHRICLGRLNYASAPTFLYRFDFDSPDFNHQRTKFCGSDPVRGVAHADDLSYLFYSSISWKLPFDSPEYKTIRRMVGIWTAFAKNSNPNCKEIEPVIWHPIQNSNPFMALNISYDIVFKELPERSKLELWNSFYKGDDLF